MPIKKRGGSHVGHGQRGGGGNNKGKRSTVFNPDEPTAVGKEAEEKARLENEAKEKERLENEAKEKERLENEAKEKERLKKEAEEKERLKKEAKEQERREEEKREEEQRLRIEQERREMELRSGTTRLTNAKFRLSPQIIYNAMVALIPNLRYIPSNIFMNKISTHVSIGETVRCALYSSGSHFLASEEALHLNELLAVFQKDGVYVKGVSEWAKVDENGIKSYKGEPELGKESVFIYRPEL